MYNGRPITENKPMSLQQLGKDVQPIVTLTSRYPDPSSVQAFFRGKKVIPCGFTPYNNPYFSHELYLEVERIREANEARGLPEETIEITYLEKKLVPGPEVFDTLEGVRNYVTDLKTLWDIIYNRRIYLFRYLPNNENLKKHFVLFGKISLTSKGSYAALFDFPKVSGIYDEIIDIETFKYLLGNSIPKASWYCDIPKADSVCSVCGGSWTLDGLKGPIEKLNYVEVGIGDSYGEYHIDCLLQKNRKTDLERFCGIVNSVYSDIALPEAILNTKLFWKVAVHEPLRTQFFNTPFKFRTPDGDIVMFKDDIFDENQITIRGCENYKPSFQYLDTFSSPPEMRTCREITVSTREEAIKLLTEAKVSV